MSESTGASEGPNYPAHIDAMCVMLDGATLGEGAHRFISDADGTPWRSIR